MSHGQWPCELAWADNLNGLAALLAGQPAEAHAWADKTVACRDDAARREPANPHLQYQTGVAQVLLAMACLGAGDVARSLALQHAAAANFQRTVTTDPGNWSVQRYLHLLQIARARTLVTAGRMAEAQTMLDSLVAGRWRPASLQAGWRVTGSWPGRCSRRAATTTAAKKSRKGGRHNTPASRPAQPPGNTKPSSVAKRRVLTRSAGMRDAAPSARQALA